MENKLVQIAAFIDPQDADFARLTIQQEEIDCYLDGEIFANTFWARSLANGGIKINVQAKDAQRAIEILKENARELFTETENTQLTCPKCNLSNIQQEKKIRILILFSSALLFICFLCLWLPFLGMLLLIFTLRWKPKYVCQSCNHKWKSE